MKLEAVNQSSFFEEEKQKFPSEKPYELFMGSDPKDMISEEKIRSYLEDAESDSDYESTSTKQAMGISGNFLEEIKENPVAIITKQPSIPDTFISLQKWEGTVLSVKKDYFEARLVDFTGNGPDEIAEFSINEVSADDLELLHLGAVFYWNIGYHNIKGGQRLRSSIIRFRRLPAWTHTEIQRSEQEAEELMKSIKTE
ncbi:MAG: hypothetical protein IH874_01145 [Candidatus Dadabacteria bacterium]|nr:hypothetical protein [Candidatus Dadabacteria bacterium]